jgi:hypothetical protein
MVAVCFPVGMSSMNLEPVAPMYALTLGAAMLPVAPGNHDRQSKKIQYSYIYISLQDLIRKTHMHSNDANKGKVNATCTVNRKAMNY